MINLAVNQDLEKNNQQTLVGKTRRNNYNNNNNYNNTSRDHENSGIVENEQNTEKSPGDLRRGVVTQTPVRNHLQGEYLRRTRKLLETKLNSRNKGINTWVVPLVRYSGPFLKMNLDKWTKELEK